MLKKNTHPLISLYKDTINKCFPLVLIFGREPNDNKPIDNDIGNYDFKEAPRCGFWNSSYAVIGNIIDENTTCHSLKNECLNKNSSFIAYTDMLYRCIKNKISYPKKVNKRRALDENKIRTHIDKIFNSSIIKRTELIIFSGIEINAGFSIEIINYANQLCKRYGKKYLHTRFFCSNNTPKIIPVLRNKSEIIGNIYSIFIAS